MDILNCKLCFEQYDELNRRPRTLGCGHFYCEECIRNIISSEILKCPVCQQKLNIKKAKEATVNYALEELLQNVKTSDIFSISPEKLKKKNTLAGVDLVLYSLTDTQYSLESLIKSKDCEIVAVKSKIELLHQTIENIKKSQLSEKQTLAKIKITQEEFQKFKLDLQNKNSPELMTSLDDQIKRIDDAQIWEENIRKEFNLMSTFYISTLLKKFSAGVYATDNVTGVKSSAYISEGNGKVHIHSFSKKRPPKGAYSLPLSSLKILSSNVNPEVFINTSNNGSFLGTVYIRVASNEHGRYFMNVCCGTYGPSYRGVQLSLLTPKLTPKPNHGTGSKGLSSVTNKHIFSSRTLNHSGQLVAPDLRCIGCKHHLNEDGTVNNTILSNISGSNYEKVDIKPGKVYAFGDGGFLISLNDLALQGIPIGEILQGAEVLQAAWNCINQRPHRKQIQNKVEMAEVGIVLNNQEQ